MAGYIAFESPRIAIRGEFQPYLLDFLATAYWRAVDEDPLDEVTFDFSECTRTFPNAMVPACVLAMWLRHDGVCTRLVLPNDPWLRAHFPRVNWAHLIDPDSFDPSDTPADQHLATAVFTDANTQHLLLNRTVELVLRTGDVTGTDLNALRWSLNEITGNVLDHAESNIGGVIQLEVLRERLAFVVADGGKTVYRSLKPTYPYLRTANEAIELATRKGVTRDRDLGQGNGLSGSLRLAHAFQGQFAIHSGEGYFRSQPDKPIVQSGRWPGPSCH